MRRIITILCLSVSVSGFAQWNNSNPPHVSYNDGNVGIGTATPLQKLDLRGNLIMESGGNPILYTGTGGVEMNRYLALINSPNSGSASGLKAGGILISDSYAYANPGKNDLIVKGNVGIGTSNPSSKFDMTGGLGTMNKLHISNAAVGLDGGYFDINMGTGDNYAAGMRAYVPSNQPGIDRVYLGFYTTTYENGLQSRIERLTINDVGNVGIGTTAPSSLLHLKNTSNNIIDLSFSTAYNGGGIRYTGTSANNSDQRLSFTMGAGTQLMSIQNSGNVGIGTTTPDAKLAVKGHIHTQEVRVDLEGAMAPDYVFEETYNLPTLAETEAYIKQHKHLPEIPSACEMEENGLNLKEMNLLLLKKIEELTLHVIELNNLAQEQQKRLATQDEKLQKLLTDK